MAAAACRAKSGSSRRVERAIACQMHAGTIPAVSEHTLTREMLMREGHTNIGKKEQRQINQLLNKPTTRGLGKETEARTVPKGTRLRGKKKSK